MLEHLLESIDQQEFETLSEDIKRSLGEHRKWMNKITTALVLHQPLTELDFIAPDAHEHCKFGRWMHKLLADPIFQQGSFLKLEQYHKELHVKARELVESLNQGEPVDEGLFTAFLESRDHFFYMVLEILEFSVINKHQFDPTTKLMNRRSVDALLAHEVHRMQRDEDANTCIVLADIDFFKRVNDCYGHDAGDKVLEMVADIFHQSIRRHDTVSRFGGEEFLFIFPDMNLAETSEVVERVRKKLAEAALDYQGQQISVTSSFGVTQLCPHCEIKDSIKRADIALYQAKSSGRNCTVSIDVAHMIEQKEMNLSEEQLVGITERVCRKIG